MLEVDTRNNIESRLQFWGALAVPEDAGVCGTIAGQDYTVLSIWKMGFTLLPFSSALHNVSRAKSLAEGSPLGPLKWDTFED
jgi:hypothetical protein